jgi:Leucine-rich repeat (LRR) protein
MFFNIPTNIEVLLLSRNSIRGNLPDPFPLEHLIRFAMADNDVNGNLPDFPTSTPLLRELDLSNQKRANGGGLIGTIWADIFKLIDLLVLNLAGNNLSREIPTTIGNLAKLKVLNLSSNALSKQIPSELGRLKGR